MTQVEQEHLPSGTTSTLRNTYKIMADHYKMYEDLFGEYGDTARLTALNGDIVATRNTEYIKEIFAHNPMDYDPFAADVTEPLTGKGSLFLIQGEKHKRERRLVMPCFQGRQMRAYGELMHNVALQRLKQDTNKNGILNTYDSMNELSMEVIIRAIFGIDDESRIEEVRVALKSIMDALHPAFLFNKSLQRSFMGLGPWAKFQRHMAVGEGLIYGEINAKREQGYGDDILSLLLQAEDEDGYKFSDQTIRDHLFTLLAAGHETTAIAMTWAMYHIHKNPEVLARLKEEVDEAFAQDMPLDQIAKLPYLTGVWKETIRIYPIVPDVLRTLLEPMDLGPYRVGKGKVVSVAISAVHHDPEIYDEPEKFKPERFIEKSYKPWEYMPFGGGHRRCVGAAFAGYEMGIVLATWIHEADFELLDTEVKPKRRNLTIAPNTPVKVRVSTRK